MRIFLTGGAGFIGSHLVEACLARGDEVVVLDNFDPFYARERKEANLATARSQPGFVRLCEGDLRDRSLIQREISEFAPDAVVHLAALAGVRPSLEAPDRYCDVNLTGTAVLLQEAVRAGVGRFLFTSSSSVYGAKPRGPFVEDAEADRPLSPYGATKRGGELLCHAVHRTSGIAITCLRVFTAFGPRQRPDLAIHKFARLMLAGKPIPVFGDGNAERDFTFVTDLADGFLRALERAHGFNTYNLGRGEPVTVNETIAILERELGVSAERDHLPPQPGDAPRTWASIDRARRELGYEPMVNYEDGIRAFVSWLRQEGGCEFS
jgi:UDP-glucuronate 4-epimerase